MPKAPIKKPTQHALLYVYGISDSECPQVEVAGVDGSKHVEQFACQGLTCWASRVSTEFSRELETKVDDLDWLADVSLRHQRAVAAIHSRCAILPARFGVVFRTRESLCAHFEPNAASLRKRLRQLNQTDEWGVKVFRRAQPAPVAAATAPRSGREYLQAKAQAAKPAPLEKPDAELQELASALAKIAQETAGTGQLSQAQPGLIWQASFLVPRARREQWDQALRRFAAKWGDHRQIECTGPWPPYSFV